MFKRNQQRRKRKAHKHKRHKQLRSNRTAKEQIAPNQQDKRQKKICNDRIHTCGGGGFYFRLYAGFPYVLQRIRHSCEVRTCHICRLEHFHALDVFQNNRDHFRSQITLDRSVLLYKPVAPIQNRQRDQNYHALGQRQFPVDKKGSNQDQAAHDQCFDDRGQRMGQYKFKIA